jgi:hypothetical protein
VFVERILEKFVCVKVPSAKSKYSLTELRPVDHLL